MGATNKFYIRLNTGGNLYVSALEPKKGGGIDCVLVNHPFDDEDSAREVIAVIERGFGRLMALSLLRIPLIGGWEKEDDLLTPFFGPDLREALGIPHGGSWLEEQEWIDGIYQLLGRCLLSGRKYS